MARVCVTGEHLVAKDLRAFVRADADLHLTTPAFARFTLDVRATLAPGSVVSVDTGPTVSATENAVIAALAQRLKRVLVQCGAGVRHEHVVVVSLPADLREQEAYDVAEALHMGLLQAAKVLPKPRAWQRALARFLLASVLLGAAASSATAQIHQVGGGSSSSSAYPAVTTATGTLTIAGDSVTIATAGMGTLGIDVPVVAFSGTISVTGKIAGATGGRSIALYRATNGGTRAFAPVTSIDSTNRAYLADVTGYASVTVTLSSLLSGGPITVSLSASPLVPGFSTMTNVTDGATVVGVQNTNGITTQGALKVYAVDAVDVPLAPLTNTELRATAVDINCLSGCGSPPATADGTAFTAGTTNVTPIAAVVDDVATTTIAENAYGAPRMTTSRVLYADLSKTGANTTALKVDGSAVTQPVSGPLTDAQLRATAVPVSGTFWQVTQPVSGNLGVSTLAGTSSSLVLTAANTIVVTPTGLSALTWYFAVGGLTGGPAQVAFEASFDNAVSYTQVPWTRLKSTGGTQDGATTALVLSLSTSDSHVVQTIVPPGADHVRVRVTSTVGAGSATVQVAGSASPATYGQFVTLAGSNVTQTVSGTVTANQGTANTIANSWPVKVTDGTNTMPTMDTVARAGFHKVTDGTNTAAVKAASTAAAATDPSLVVGLSPNSPIPTGTNTIGALTANQSVNVNQVAGAAAATAASGTLKVGVVGNAGAALDAANNAAMPANAAAVGLQTATIDTSPTAATAGNLRYQLASTEGIVYVQEGGPKRFSCVLQAVTVLTQCQAAPAAGLRAYVTSVHLSNQAATVQTLDVVFGTGTNCATGATAITHKWQMGTNATTTSPQSIDASFDTPLVPTAANAICVRPSAATAFGATITGYIAP